MTSDKLLEWCCNHDCLAYSNCDLCMYNKGKADAIDELKNKKDEIIKWLLKRDKERYGTTNGELLDHIFEIAEQLKGK